MIRKNKNILIFLGVGIVLIVSIFFSLDKKEYHELPQVKLKEDINKSGLAIMIETDYKSGEYQKSDSTIFPTDGYTLNRIKSGCVDKNGKDVDALTYNEDNKTINIKTKQSVYCYLYYDNLFKGKGTEDEPYQINYIEDLVRLSNSVNIDQNNYQNKNFILTRDLDFNVNDSYMKYNDTGFGDINGVNNIEGIKDELTNIDGSGFIPIGNPTTYFQGNFNGNNKRLDNLYLNLKSTSNAGLFAYVHDSKMLNLTISGNIIDTAGGDIGGLISYAVGTNTIDNVHSYINILKSSNQSATAGIIGSIYDNGNLTIINSSNNGNITGGEITGGLIGYTNGTLTIENSYNAGIITNEVGDYVGGLLGKDTENSNKTIIQNSYNTGALNNSKHVQGGLAGFISGTIEIDNCYNSGTITNTLGTLQYEITDLSGVYIGGLLGYSDKNSNVKFKNSNNKGNMNTNIIEEVRIFMGGLAGVIRGDINVKNCYNSGNLINDKEYTTYIYSDIGGLIARISDKRNNNAIIEDSYNMGTIKNARLPGGLIGEIGGSGYITIINRCYNAGDIIIDMISPLGERNAGGLISDSYNPLYILNSFNTGNIYLNPGGSNGIASFLSANRGYITILNSYNAGNYELIGDDTNIRGYVCGVINLFDNGTGAINYDVKINNMFNIGKLFNTNIPAISYFKLKFPYDFKNIYYNNTYLNGSVGNDANASLTPMSEDDMKSKTFVDTLNQNVDELNNAGLETIDESLKGYELNKWIQGSDDYPILTRKIEDLSGHGNHGTSYAVKYDKEGIITSTDTSHLGYVDAGLTNHEFNNSVSFVVRMELKSKLNKDNALMGNWDYPSYGGGISAIGFSLSLDTGYNVLLHNQDVEVGKWYTIIGTYDGNLEENNMKIYINGIKVAEKTINGKILASSIPIVIGGDPDIQNDIISIPKPTDATFKEALIFDRALTEEKDHISTNYKDDINVTNQDELLLWYKF